MASTASDSLPSSPAAPASSFLDDHHDHLPLFLMDPATTSSLHAAAAAEEAAPAPPQPGRKPPRKRPRASRRPPTTVVTIDASNFRAMVHEFTGFPAPPPFAHLGGPGALFGAGAPAGVPFELRPPSPLKLPAAPLAPPPTCPATSFALSLFASSDANPADAAAAVAAVTRSSSSEFYSGLGPTLSGAVAPRYDGSFPAAGDERVSHGHGLFSSFLQAGDRYRGH